MKQAFEAALALKPETPARYHVEAVIAFNAGDGEKAVKAALKCIELSA